MSIRKLAVTMAKKEGKKSQVKIGDIREIFAILSDMFYEEKDRCKMCNMFVDNGRKRASKPKGKQLRKMIYDLKKSGY